MAESGFNWGGLAGGLIGGLGSMIGAGINSATQKQINKENIAMQKEFAQNGIQWKVQDAKKAGIHPSVALGAQTYQATPSSVAPDVGSGVSGAFKHFGSAIDSFIDDKEEERNLQLEALKLANEKDKLEIAKMKQGANNGNVSLNPNTYISSNSNLSASNDIKDDNPSTSIFNSGVIYGTDNQPYADVTIDKNMDGSFSLNYSKDRQDTYNENWIERTAWTARNTFDYNYERDIANIRRSAKVPDNMAVVPLPYRPGSGRRFKIVPKADVSRLMKKFNSPWEQIKAIFYANDEN